MTQIEKDTLQALCHLQRTFKKIYSYHVAMEINRCERQARIYLARLESTGLVCRPNGGRGGWVVA